MSTFLIFSRFTHVPDDQTSRRPDVTALTLTFCLLVANGLLVAAGSGASAVAHLAALGILFLLAIKSWGRGYIAKERVMVVVCFGGVVLLATAAALIQGTPWPHVFATATPFVILVLLLANNSSQEQWMRVFSYLAPVAALLSILYIMTALTDLRLYPGVNYQLPGQLGPLSVWRTYAPGGLLFVVAALWGCSRLILEGYSGRALIFAASGACAALFTLSRTILLAFLVSALVLVVVARGGGAGERRRALYGGALLAILGTAAAAVNPRIAGSLGEIASGTGNFGTRIELLQGSTQLLYARRTALLGFSPETILSTDSSVAVLVGIFGKVLLAVLGLVIIWIAVQAVISHARRPRSALLSLAAVPYLTFLLVASFTTDSLSSDGGIALLGLSLTALLSLKSRVGAPNARLNGTSGAPYS